MCVCVLRRVRMSSGAYPATMQISLHVHPDSSDWPGFPLSDYHTTDPCRQKLYHRACVPYEASDRPVHSRSLIRIFTGRFLDSQVCKAFSDAVGHMIWYGSVSFKFVTGYKPGHIKSQQDGSEDIWVRAWQNQQNGMCAQRKLRSACASAQSDQSLHYPHEECFGP